MRPLIPMLLALASAPALAHPGHGHGHGEGFSLSHWLSAPEHAWSLGLLAMVIVAGLFARRWQRRRSRR